MKISVEVKPNSKERKVIEKNNTLIVLTPKKPQNNEANKDIIRILKEYFKEKNKKIKTIKIEKGHNKKRKLINVEFL